MSIAASWRPSISGPARYDDLLLPPGVARISLGEGGTPLIPAGEVLLKCEHLNPTGSYKDRIAAVGVSLGVNRGAAGWIGTSSGNAGAAFAAYGARAGLKGRLITVDGVVPEKLGQARAHGVEVCEVEGFGIRREVEARVLATVEEIARMCDLVLGISAHAFNRPAMAGAKAIAYEIIEQHGGAPSAVYVPMCGGGLLVSVCDGFAEWRRLGLIDRVPRMVGVQPAGCAPIHASAVTGAAAVESIPECVTTISGLQLTSPPDGNAALTAVRASDGWTVAVEDDATYAAQRALAQDFGVFVEPAAACAYAGWLQRPAEDAIIVLTGSGLKTLGERREKAPRQRIAVDEIAAWAAF